MGILISKAILHIVDNTTNKVFISDEELDFESETCSNFINKHLKRLINSPDCKEATFNIESETYNDIVEFKSNIINFKEFSMRIVERFSQILLKHVDIPSADILIVKFLKDDIDHLGIIKLNYNECIVHSINIDEEGTIDNQIAKYKTVLPLTGTKVSEACIIPFDPMIIRLLEKPYLIDGEPEYYFSKYFLDCDTELSKKETVEIIDEVNRSITQKYFNNNLDTLVSVSNAIIEEAEENDGVIRMENVASKMFGENTDVKNEYIEILKESGIKKDLELGEDFIKKFFGVQKFKADNGVEIKFPAELKDSDNSIEFINNSDGTVTITFKNLRKKIQN